MILLFYNKICIYLNSNNEQVMIHNIVNNNIPTINEYVIQIPKININKIFYPIKDSRNNIDQGLQLIDDDPIIIAGHSGNSIISYFTKLQYLNIGNLIKIYMDKPYNYYIYKKSIINKTNQMRFKKNHHLYLITCYKNKRLVIEAKNRK